jgi:hypothetical protein
MPPQKKLLRGWRQETTERSLLMRQLPFVSIQTGTMDFQVRPCRRRVAYCTRWIRYTRYIPSSWTVDDLATYSSFLNTTYLPTYYHRTVQGTAHQIANVKAHFEPGLLPNRFHCPHQTLGRRWYRTRRYTSDGQCHFGILRWWQGFDDSLRDRRARTVGHVRIESRTQARSGNVQGMFTVFTVDYCIHVWISKNVESQATLYAAAS